MTSQNPHLSELRKTVATAPSSPGVYRWMNEKEEVLYIGKAKNLKNRLKSYTQESTDKTMGPWKLNLREKIAGIDWTVTNTELEALVLETNMIKEVRPKYNVLMKDDKNYVYVRISIHEDYPAISILRHMQKDKAKYFGPFLSSYEIKKILETLHLIYPFKACKESLKLLNSPIPNPPSPTPCLDSQIGQCNGLCRGETTQEEHRKAIDQVIGFLKGDHKPAREFIEQEMKDAAVSKKFERAARLRDALTFIENLKEKQLVSDTSGEDIDFVGLSILGTKAHVVILHQRTGRVLREESIALRGEGEDPASVLEQFLTQYYGDRDDIPSLIVIGLDLPESELLEEWLRETRGGAVELRAAERGKKSKLLELAERNAAEKIRSEEAKWETAKKNAEQALEELQSALDLPDVPKRIECYDISHTGGSETVGSMVVSVSGKASSKDYRSFTIRSLRDGEVDDYKALAEVLTRRCKYLKLDLKKEEAMWNEKGVTFGKTRKAELADIKNILKEQSLHDAPADTTEYIVARHEEKIVAMGGIQEYPKKLLEMRSIWVDKNWQGKRLGQYIARRILKKNGKTKTYIITDPTLEDYYNDIGFQTIRSAPETLEAERKLYKKDDPDFAIIMAFDPKTQKKDSSLTSTPDLLVIDGGKGQLSTIVDVLKSINLEIPVIGLAKREEEVFIPGQSYSVDLIKDSQGSLLLQRLRNEAHRFANEHRKKRAKTGLLHSALDDLPGLGPKTREALVKRFGSVKRAKEATDEELLECLTRRQLEELRKLQ